MTIRMVVQNCDKMIWLSKVFCDEMSNMDMIAVSE